MRFIWAFILGIAITPLQAQLHDNPFYLWGDETSISGTGEMMLNASALNQDWFSIARNGDTLSADLTDQLISRHDNKNRIGGLYNLGLSFHQPLGNGHLYAYIKDKAVIGAEYNKTLTELILLGNGPYLGTTLNSGPVKLEFARFQQIGLGYGYQWSPKSQFYSSVAFVNGEQLAAVDIDRLDITTDINAEYIDFDYAGEAQLSDSSKKGFAAHNGLGVSFEIGQRFLLGAEQEHQISFLVQDLGFITWSAQTLNYQRDTAWRYDGFELQWGDSTSSFSNVDPDSLQALLTGQPEFTTYKYSLPMSVLVEYIWQGEKHTTTFVFQYTDMSGYIPFVLANYRYHITPTWHAGISLSTGGFGGPGGGLELAYQGEKFDLLVGTRNLEKYLLPSRSLATSGYLKWQLKF